MTPRNLYAYTEPGNGAGYVAYISVNHWRDEADVEISVRSQGGMYASVIALDADHLHDLGTALLAHSRPCDVPPHGWWCSRRRGHSGPCAARPRWWNLAGRWWMGWFR